MKKLIMIVIKDDENIFLSWLGVLTDLGWKKKKKLIWDIE